MAANAACDFPTAIRHSRSVQGSTTSHPAISAGRREAALLHESELARNDPDPHPCSVAPAEGPEKCGPRRPTRSGPSCNNAWRQQREAGLTPKKRGRKMTAVDPQRKKLEQEHRRLTSRLQKAEALLAFQKKVSELLQIPLKPFVSDEDD